MHTNTLNDTARRLPTWSAQEEPAGPRPSSPRARYPNVAVRVQTVLLHPEGCVNAAALDARGWAGREASASGSRRFYFGSGRGRREGCGRGGESQIKITLSYEDVRWHRIFTSASHITFAFARWRRVQLPRISPSRAVRPNAPRGVRTQAAGPGRGTRAGLTGFGRGGLHPRGMAPGSPGEG